VQGKFFGLIIKMMLVVFGAIFLFVFVFMRIIMSANNAALHPYSHQYKTL